LLPGRHGLWRGCCDGEEGVPGMGLVTRRGSARPTLGEKTVRAEKAEPLAPGTPRHTAAFEELFRSAYQPLLRDVIFFGGNLQEAEDAVSAALAEVFQRWDTIEHPRAYARRAAISNLIKIKNKQRGQQRIEERMIERGDYPPEHDLDPETAWAQQEWVLQLLKSLPPAQQEVLACLFDMFTQREIAQLLGKTDAAIRQNLRAARKRLESEVRTGAAAPTAAIRWEEDR
jgi:RNA polymerase sigma factor (sigma-70 family)